MCNFSNFISCHCLVDPHLKGARFTWSNKQASPTMSRLDRFLFFPSWEDHFGVLTQRALPNPDSDHVPLLLSHDEELEGPSPFHFELIWLQVLGFKEFF